MLGLFKNKPTLNDDAVKWLFDTFAWSFRNFGADVFYHETILVVPSNKYFPGRENSIHGMAKLVFDQVKEYAGLKHWPLQLVEPENYVETNPTEIKIEGALRGSHGIAVDSNDDAHNIFVSYNPQQVIKPEALIANYAHILAHYLGTMAKEPPPGEQVVWPHATELLAIFMGFGLMFANSAYTYKGGCASCFNPLAERSAFLSQDEATYALAIFCVLKNIPNQDVLPHIKSYLRPFYKRTVKEIRDKKDDWVELKES